MGKSVIKKGRRAFLGDSARLAAAASVLGMSQPLAQAKTAAAQPEPGQPPEFIIDSHIHCGGTEAWVQEMVEFYRPRNVMACVLTWMKDLELVKDAIARYPDIFIGYGRTDPDKPDAVREVDVFQQAGFLGMKFHSPQKNWDDPSYFQLYRKCEDYRMHVLFHTGISSHTILDQPQWGSSARMRPIYLDTICRQFPKLTVQGAHLGNPWYDEAAETARWNPNLLFDVTGSTLLKLIKLGQLERMSEILWWASDESEANPHTLKGGPGAWEHIVFGTDEKPSGLPANIERFQMMLDANRVPESTRKKMWGLTIANILGIDPQTRKRRS